MLYRARTLDSLNLEERQRLKLLTNEVENKRSIMSELLDPADSHWSVLACIAECDVEESDGVRLEGQWVGWAAAWWDRHASIASVGCYVDKDWRRKGHGSYCVERLKSALGAFRLTLRARPSGPDAVHFYYVCSIELHDDVRTWNDPRQET